MDGLICKELLSDVPVHLYAVQEKEYSSNRDIPPQVFVGSSEQGIEQWSIIKTTHNITDPKKSTQYNQHSVLESVLTPCAPVADPHQHSFPFSDPAVPIKPFKKQFHAQSLQDEASVT